MSKPSYAPNSLGEALSVRYPTVWVYSPDTVEVIDFVRSHVRKYEDLEYYLMHNMDGLQVFNYRTERFDTVLMERINPHTGDLIQMPIMEFGAALQFLYSKGNATLLVLNSEQFKEDLNDLHTFMQYEWRNSWKQDQSNYLPPQIVLTSSVEPGPPAAVNSFVPLVHIGYPTEVELKELLTHISVKTNNEVEIDKAAAASKGLSTFEAISLYHSQIARHDKIDVEELEQIKFDKIASRTSLQIIKPKISLEDVAGAENIKKILETSLWIKANPKLAERYGFKSAMHRFLLLGLPGTGKSFVCEAAANFLGLNLVRTGMSQMMSKYVGESENNISAMFEQINALSPVCVWSDEFGRDASGGQSSHVVDAGTTTRMHGLFLTGIQELPQDTYFFAAANDISTLAPEMLRADRFDKIFFVGFPTQDQRLKIITDLVNGIEHKINLENIAEASASYTGAEIKSALASASSMALAERRAMTTADLMTALSKMKDRLWGRYRGNVIDQYSKALNQYEWASDDQYEEGKIYAKGSVPNGKKMSQAVHNPIAIKASVS
jgi:ATP-dependent 26S proteasome regulatory subunit